MASASLKCSWKDAPCVWCLTALNTVVMYKQLPIISSVCADRTDPFQHQNTYLAFTLNCQWRVCKPRLHSTVANNRTGIGEEMFLWRFRTKTGIQAETYNALLFISSFIIYVLDREYRYDLSKNVICACSCFVNKKKYPVISGVLLHSIVLFPLFLHHSWNASSWNH